RNPRRVSDATQRPGSGVGVLGLSRAISTSPPGRRLIRYWAALACPRDTAPDAGSANADHVREPTLWSGLFRHHHTGLAETTAMQRHSTYRPLPRQSRWPQQ